MISEINQRINAIQGVGPGAQVAAPQAAPPPVPALAPAPAGASRVQGGVALRNDPEAVRKVLADRAAREAAAREAVMKAVAAKAGAAKAAKPAKGS